MADISTLPSRSTPFSGNPNLVQPVIPGQIFHSTDTDEFYRANSLALGDLTVAASSGGSGGSGGGPPVTTGSVTPIGNVTPSAVGELYIWDNSIPLSASSGPVGGYKKVYYRSTGTSNTNWEAFGGTAVVYIDENLTGSSDFMGQQVYEFNTTSTGLGYNRGFVSYQTGQNSSDWVRTF